MVAINAARAQGYAFYVGLPLHIQPMADIGAQLRFYGALDSNYSNHGPGLGCEFNFGNNNSGITVGPKLFYQADIFMTELGEKRKLGSLYLVGRLSAILYANSIGRDMRLAPEGGVSLFDLITLTYGYNFQLPGDNGKKLQGVFDSRFTLYIYINNKTPRKKPVKK